jgi:hypothetical protein
MVAFCRLCGLGFHSLAQPDEAGVLELIQRAHVHFAQSHPDMLVPLSVAALRLSGVILSRALEWGQDARAVEAVRAELRSTLMSQLAWDGVESVRAGE